ncbi:MAG: sporulation protein YqfD [Bacilli bacterium]|nr:sporulation protein YqfD [Bacilli bacterium]
MKRYLVTTAKDNLIHLNHFRIRNIENLGEEIQFTTGKKQLEDLSKIIELKYLDLTTKALKAFIHQYLITIIGVLIIIIVLISQSRSIREISFTDEETYNPEILNFLDQYLNKKGPFYFLNKNINEISYDLRSEFYQYEWIGVRRQGAVLYIDIKEIKNQPIDEDKTPGSIYAKHSGIVKRYHVERGVVLVQEEVYVSEGSLLISGAITHYDNQVENVRAKGYVIAEVLQYHDLKILKERSEIVRSGKMESKEQFYLFSKKIGEIISKFSNYEIEEGKLRNYGLFKIQDLYYYETKEVKTIYSENEAIQYAKSLVIKEFRKNKVNQFEKIIYNNLVRIEFDGKYYHIRLITKTYQNIAEFIPLIN